MTINEYQKKCVDQLPKYLYRGDEALLGLMSLNATTGKCMELYKKTLYEGTELPQEEFLDTLSEILFGVAVVAHAFDTNLGKLFKRNAEKIDSDAGDDNN